MTLKIILSGDKTETKLKVTRENTHEKQLESFRK